MLLDAWRDSEREPGGDVSVVEKLMPKKIKMKRIIAGSDEDMPEYEEYYEYQFPDDEKQMGTLKTTILFLKLTIFAVAGLKILEKAMLWKQQMALTTPTEA